MFCVNCHNISKQSGVFYKKYLQTRMEYVRILMLWKQDGPLLQWAISYSP
jgi:hypothetical protein